MSEQEQRIYELTAILQPFMADDVKQAFVNEGIIGMTVTEAKGYGRQLGHKELHRGSEYSVEFLLKIQIVVILPEEKVSKAIDILLQLVREKGGGKGKIGDGIVYVKEVLDAIRLRTGERLFSAS